MNSRVTCCAPILAAVMLAGVARAQDWPQWRGPHRDGVAAGIAAPKPWPEKPEPKWKVEVGLGHSSPIVVGGDVFIFTRRGEQESIACLKLSDGTERWRQSYAAPYDVNPAAVTHGPGPKSTPTVAGGRVFTFGISGILACWDAKTGHQQWKHEFSREYPATSPLYGSATSPLVDGDRCIVFVGGHDQGALIAFDIKTGAQRWSWQGDGPAYASPVIATFSKSRQIVTQSQRACVGIGAADGKLLWQIPFETAYDQNSVTPLVFADSVIFSGLNRGVARYRVELQGEKWKTDQIWETREASMYMNSPVVSGDRLFGFSHRKRGQLFALSITTGKILWVGDGRQSDNAALVKLEDAILALTTDAKLIAFEDSGKQFVELTTYKVAATPTWAHPAVVSAGLLVKEESQLALWPFEFRVAPR